MKKIRAIALVVLSISCLISCKPRNQGKKTFIPQKNSSISNQILALEKARLDATNQLDTTQLKTFLAPQYEWTTAYGKLLNTQQMLGLLKKRVASSVQEIHSIKSPTVELYNDNNIALVKGIYVVEKRERNGLIVLTSRFSDIYILDSLSGTWKLLHSQHSRIKS